MINDENMNFTESETQKTEELNTEIAPNTEDNHQQITEPSEAIPETVPEVIPSEGSPIINPADTTPEMPPSEVIPESPDTAPSQEIPAAPAPEFPQQNQANYSAPVGSYSAPPYTPPYSASYAAPPYTSPYANPQVNPGQPVAKKRSVGARVMLICLWVLLGIFGTVIVGTCGYFMGTNNTKDKNPLLLPDILDEYIHTIPTEPSAEEDEEAIIPDSSHLFDENGEIVLNNYPKNINDTEKYNTRSAYEKVSPSTVGIMCYSDKAKEKPEGQGTGIVINKDGYIATNSHVIGDSKTAYIIEVILEDGNKYTAQVVGYDTRTDLAVIKVDADNLVPAEFADSDLISIGEDVIAVGNPGGMEFQNTLTRGIISAKDRTLGLSTQVSYIQTDAAINPGNSGGPLCNLGGQVIGINSAKIASSEYEGMGFAIPSRTVKEVVDDLIKQGYVSGRVKIGITGTAITASQAEYNKVPQGIVVAEITPDGPCDNGEVKVNDIVVALDDTEIKSFSDIYTALTKYSDGDKATLRLYRPETKEYIDTIITLQADNGSTSVN